MIALSVSVTRIGTGYTGNERIYVLRLVGRLYFDKLHWSPVSVRRLWAEHGGGPFDDRP